MHDFAERKLEFIREVSAISDEAVFFELENTLHKFTAREKYRQLTRPTRKKFDAEAIRRKRNIQGHDHAEIFRLIKAVDIQEPIQLLLSQLSK